MKSGRLYIDPRAGSRELLAPLRRLALPAKASRMRFGDVAFLGSGPAHPRRLPEGVARIGIEFKSIGDLLACIVDKRLVSHQVPGLLRHYDYAYLLVEGCVRPAPDSALETLRLQDKEGRNGAYSVGFFNRTFSGVTYSAMQKYLLTLENLAGLRVRFTSDRRDTLGYLAALYHWWQKPWEKHNAHLALPSREDSHPPPGRASALFRRPSVLRRVAACLPGIGWKRSQEIARRFRSVSAMVEAAPSDWVAVEGIGPKTAQAIHKALRGAE